MNPFEQESKDSGGGLTLTQNSITYLEASAKWARFLAILGFIGCGLMVLAALIMFVIGAAQSGRSSYDYGGYYYRRGPFDDFPVALLGVGYLIAAVLWFFPMLNLNNFATRMLNALAMRDSMTLESSFEQMRNYWRYRGIMTIILISLYIFVLLIALVAGASGGFR